MSLRDSDFIRQAYAHIRTRHRPHSLPTPVVRAIRSMAASEGMKPPILSVISTVGQTVEVAYVRNVAESLANQSWLEWIVVVHPRASSSVANVLAEFAPLNRYVLSTVATDGPARKRNRGAKTARGMALQFLDIDDHVNAASLRQATQGLVKNWSGASSVHLYPWRMRSGEDSTKLLVAQDPKWHHHSARLWPRELFLATPGYSETRRAEDAALNFFTAEKTVIQNHLARDLAFFEWQNDSRDTRLTQRADLRDEQRLAILDLVVSQANKSLPQRHPSVPLDRDVYNLMLAAMNDRWVSNDGLINIAVRAADHFQRTHMPRRVAFHLVRDWLTDSVFDNPEYFISRAYVADFLVSWALAAEQLTAASESPPYFPNMQVWLDWFLSISVLGETISDY